VPTNEGVNQYGDVVEVNSQPWPFMNVEPRKYRFRLFDMSLSRPWDLHMSDESGNWIEFPVIASDCGLFESPVTTKDVQIAPGERFEIVFDFSPYAGQNVTMGNAMGTGPLQQITSYQNTDKVMQFVVGHSVSDNSNNGDVPGTLNANIPWPASTTQVSQTFNFENGGDARWTINGIDYDDVNNRVLARPQQGSTELWKVNYAGGPGTHPVHVHLVSFQIVSRTGGTRGLLPYEAAGLKDIVHLEPGESAEVLAVYGPWNGLYMFHCHNLIHEDNMMMAVFNITQLENQGYNVTTDYTDPMDPRFAPQWPQDNTWDDDQISSSISYYAGLHCYDSTYSGAPVSTSPPWSVGAEPTQYAAAPAKAAANSITGSASAPANTGSSSNNNNNGQWGQGSGNSGQSWGPPQGQNGQSSQSSSSPQSPNGQFSQNRGPPQGQGQGQGQFSQSQSWAQHAADHGQNQWGNHGAHKRDDADSPASSASVVTKAVTHITVSTTAV